MDKQKYKQAILVGGGDFDQKQLVVPKDDCYVIAVDKGYEYIKDIIKVDYALGDFDSLGYVPDIKNKQVYKISKDYTDMHLALIKCQEMQINKIDIYGGLGARLDHTLANIQNATNFAKRGMDITFFGNENVLLSNSEINISGEIGQTISVLAMTDCAIQSSNGLKYSLNNKNLTTDYALGISNVLIDNHAQIKIKKGVIAVIINKRESV